jgi:hypothetical protein
MENETVLNYGYCMQLATQGECTSPARILIEDLLNGNLVKPEHQRDYLWPDAKRKSYINDIFNMKRQPIGVICTYQVELDNGGGSPIYLNDGLQRLSTLQELKDVPTKYNRSPNEVDAILRTLKLTIQHRHYSSHTEAAKYFQGINSGTSCTPYDFYKESIVYSKNYRAIEKSLDELFTEFDKCDARLTKSFTREKDAWKKGARDIYCLLHRVLVSNYSTSIEAYSYITNNQVSSTNANKEQIEHLLFKEFDSRRVDEIINAIKEVINITRSNVAMMEYAINKYNDRAKQYNSEGNLPTKKEIEYNTIEYSFWRWINMSMLCCKKNGLPVNKIIEILDEVLFLTGGRNRGKYRKNKDSDDVQLRMAPQNLSHFYSFMKFLNIDIAKEKRISTNSKINKHSMDDSHKFNFAENGNGETFTEPASINRARGMKDVV